MPSYAELKDYQLHAVTTLTGASVAMSQISELAIYSPIAAALAFILSASSYKGMLKRADNLVDALDKAEVLDEEIADAIEEFVNGAETVAVIVE